MQTHLSKIRSDAAECLLLSTLAADDRSKMFAKMAEHLNDLASEVERGIANQPKLIEGKLDPVQPQSSRAADAEIDNTVHQQNGTPTDPAPQTVGRPRRMWPWLVIASIVLIAGSFVWRVYPEWPNSAQARPAEDSTKAMPAPKTAEQSDYQEISNRLSAVEARVEAVAGELEKLSNSKALVMSPVEEAPRRKERRHRRRGVQRARQAGFLF